MNVFFDTSAFLKILKKEAGYVKVIEWLTKVRSGEHRGFTDSIVIAEMVYAFLARARKRRTKMGDSSTVFSCYIV